jgi:hypothetical protein
MAAKKGNKVILWGIVGLLFFGMVGFGATGLSGTVRTLGSVGDKDIGLNDYARELNQQMRAYEAQTGAPLSFADAQAIGLDQAVLAQMVARRSLDNEVARLGLSVGDERVREQILRISAFQGISGEFDRLSTRPRSNGRGNRKPNLRPRCEKRFPAPFCKRPSLAEFRPRPPIRTCWRPTLASGGR